MSVERSSTTRFTTGVYGAISTIIILVVLCVQNIYAVTPTKLRYSPHEKVHIGLAVTQIGMAVITLVACVSLPRRPAVFLDNGKPVDGEFTVSLFNRLTFAWNQSFLEVSSRKIVQLDDLPRPACRTRASALQQSFDSKRRPSSLWKSIFFAHYQSFLVQFILTVLQALFEFVPQLSLFKILSLLEVRTSGQEIGYEIWIWVSFQGLGLVIEAWFASWATWISLSQLSLPIRVELTASIFRKAMRKKDVKEVKKASSAASEHTQDDTSTDSGPGAGGQPENKDPIQREKEPEAKLKHSTVNLINVDAARVCDFGSMIRAFPDAIMNLVISVSFLLVIIGWKSLLAGLAAFLLIIPLNTWSTRKFGVIQDQLMTVRDEKTETVSEALGGLRQIKFSALENQWQAKIGEVRGRELHLLW